MRTTRTRRAGAYRRAWTAGRVALVLTLFAAVLVVMPPVANAATGDLVMVTGSGGLGEGDDTSKHAYLQSLGWTVTVMDDSSSAGVYSAAASANDVMFVSDTVADAAVVEANLPGLDIGMVIETYGPKFAVLYSPTNDEGFVGDAQVDIVDGSHYITRTLGVGTRTIYSTSADLNFWDATANPLPAGVDVLAERVPNASHEALYVAETGADLYGANTAPNRRVFLPSDAAGYANWTTDYRTIVERSLDWAAGVVVTVNSTGDVSDSVAGDGVCDTGGTIGTDPECTLRAAIEEVNAGGAVDRIEFDITAALVGGAHTIAVTGTRLPAITQRVAIDATTEPDATSGPVVVLDGGAVSGPGIELGTGSDGSLIRGVAIHSFPGSGIAIGTDGNVVAGNRIGTDHVGSAGLGNASSGVYVWNGANNRIGGVGADGNTITGNADGVVLDAGADSGNAILGNSIWANDFFGIDLLNDGATDNDALDADGGPNDRLNFPTLTPPAGGDTSLRIELDVPAGDYRIEVFENPTEGADASGRGEGEVFLHADTVTHTGSGSEAFTLPGVLALTEADVVSLTATEDLGGGIYGSTSEFSVATTVGPAPEEVVLNRIQDGTATLANGTSTETVTIDAVDPAKAFLTFSLRGNDGTPSNLQVRGQLANATTVAFNRFGTASDVVIEWSVVEFSSGVTVQRGTEELTTASEGVTVAAVDLSRSFPLVGGSVNGSVYGDNDFIRAELTSATNLQLTVRGATNQNFVDWQVVTYNQSAVQTGSVNLGTGDTSATATVAAIDPTKSWLVYSAETDNGAASDIGQKFVRGLIADPTTLTFDRSNTGQEMLVQWYLVEFTDAAAVQHASVSLASPDIAQDVTISTVNRSRSVAYGGYLQYGSRTNYAADDNPGVGYFTTELTSASNLRVQRDAALAPADLGWFVIEWPCPDADGDGLGDCEEDANTDADNDPATNPGPDTDGDTLPNYLDADDDGDGLPTSTENADPDGDGDPRDALDVDRDGEPDYLDAPTAATSPLVAEEQKISSTEGGLTGPLVDFDAFGTAVSAIGDLDGDGIVDVVVGADFDDDGASASGAVYILFMNTDGTVRDEQKISALSGGLTGPVGGGDSFGSAVAGIGDLDGDGTPDIAVGARADDDGVSNAGAVYILFMNTDGTVRDEQKISATVGGFNATLESLDFFGSSLAGAGDLDGDGLGDLIVGAQLDDGAGSNRGAIYVLFLRADGTVRAEQEISRGQGGLAALIDDSDTFGFGVGRIGDVDGDGVEDIVVGARGDDDGGSGRGAVYVLFMNPDGTVKAEQKISELEGGLATVLGDGDAFGTDVAGIGDLNRDGVGDILVGANGDDDGGSDSGAVYVLLLNADGTVMAEQKISDSEGGFETPLSLFDEFGSAVGGLGDLDGDGTIDVVVGATSDDDGGAGRGAIYRIDLSPPSLVVNATGDASDLTPGDGLCDTGVDLAGPADECTLRAAIEEANASGPADIAFAIPTSDAGYDPTGFWRIAPATQLPRVTVTVSIDGTSQPGYVDDPIIEIADPASVSTGLEVDGASSVVRGLSIVGFQNGLRVGGSNSIVQGNWIGTRPDGTEFGNFYGLVVDGGSGALIGGSGVGEGNVIARAFTSGIRLTSGSATVQGNSIGRRPDGVVTLMDVGIEIDTSGHLIGGIAPGEGNEITGSTETPASRGVRVDAGTGSSIIGNTIFGNAQNTDLGGDGRTANDPLDADTGANDLLNTPLLSITATTPLGGGTSTVDLDVALDVPAGDYRIEIFDGAAAGFGGEGEGEAIVHAFTVTHPGGGAQVFSTSYSGPDPQRLSATTTEDFGASSFGSTSEFSVVTGVLTGTLVVNSTEDTGDANFGDGVCDTSDTNSQGATECTLRAAIEEANRGVAATIEFDLTESEAGYVAADGYWRLSQVAGDWERLQANGLILDGSSQTGYDGSRPLVYVDDALGGSDTFALVGDDVILRGVAIGRPGDDAVQIEGTSALVDSVWIGLDPAGDAAGSTSTGREGIIIYSGSLGAEIINSRIANLDSGIISNSGTIDATITGTEIFDNGNGGIAFNNGGRITSLGNSIHDNVGLGIDLGANDGVPLPNDVGDADNGPNDLLNHPVLTDTTIGAGTVDVDYTIDVPAGTYRIEFFDSERPDPTGFGEGQTFLSAETIVHPGGSANYNATVIAALGDVLTATATPDLGAGSYGGTSEFSNAALVGIVFVNSTGDGGDLAIGDGVCDTGGVNADGFVECTLRAAIEEANASADVDIIHFQIPESDPGFTPGAVDHWTITPATTLGLATDISSLDATTQPGWADQPIIELDGSSVVAGIDRNGILLSDGMTLRGMSITNWLDFGVLTGSTGAIISSNWLGVAPDGSVVPNGGDVLTFGSANGLVVGGPTPAEGNLFAAGGDNDGVLIVNNSTNILVENNSFGVTADGFSGLGSTTAEHVVIADDASDVVVRGNQFGGSPNAAVAVTNNASEIDIVGNVFGTDATGTAILPNAQALYAATSGAIRFGGTGAGEGNIVRNAVVDALLVDTGQTGPLSVLGNSISGSGELGMDLIPNDATPNDPNDADTGPNGLLNYPEIVSATTSDGTTEILFTLDVPGGNYRIEAFANPSGANPTGFGEGEVFRGATTITHAGGGSQSFAMMVSGDTANLSMTATEDLGGGTFGATSEFSQVAAPVAAATVEDLSVRRNDLTAAGGNDPSVLAGGIAADGLRFDGGAERLVGPANEVDGSAFTMSAWVQLGTFGSEPRILSKGSGVGAVYEMLVDDASGEAVARLEVGGVVREVRGGSLSIGTLHHVATTWNGSTVALYVDGQLVDTVAASGALGTDLSEPLVIGNTSAGTAGLDGVIDQIEIHGRAMPGAEVLARFRNGSNPTLVQLGGEQTDAAGDWTTSAIQARSGGNSLAAPETTPGANAWITAIGVDEPGVELTAWWWVSDAVANEVAVGSRTGTTPTDQFDASASGTGLDLGVLDGAVRTSADNDPTTLTPGVWQRVVFATDELGVSTFSLDGITRLGPSTLAGLASGSVGFRAADIDPGQQWFIDDVQIRRLVSDEPTTSFGPVERN